MVTRFDRRTFMGLGALSLSTSLVEPRATASQQQHLESVPNELLTAPPIDVVRIGFVGVGLQGSSHCRNLPITPNNGLSIYNTNKNCMAKESRCPEFPSW